MKFIRYNPNVTYPIRHMTVSEYNVGVAPEGRRGKCGTSAHEVPSIGTIKVGKPPNRSAPILM